MIAVEDDAVGAEAEHFSLARLGMEVELVPLRSSRGRRNADSRASSLVVEETFDGGVDGGFSFREGFEGAHDFLFEAGLAGFPGRWRGSGWSGGFRIWRRRGFSRENDYGVDEAIAVSAHWIIKKRVP